MLPSLARLSSTVGYDYVKGRWDFEKLKVLLKAGADPNERFGTYEETALMEAAKAEDVEAVKLLLSYRAKVDIQDLNGNTALIWAVGKGNVEIVKLLLSYGANVDIRGIYDRTALIKAVIDSNVEIVTLLLLLLLLLLPMSTTQAANTEGTLHSTLYYRTCTF